MRRPWGGGLVACALVLGVLLALPRASRSSDENPILAENALPGTVGWLGQEATAGAADVYAGETDAFPGDVVDVHVSTTPVARYRVLVYRLGRDQGVGARPVPCRPARDGAEVGGPRAAPPAGLSGSRGPRGAPHRPLLRR